MNCTQPDNACNSSSFSQRRSLLHIKIHSETDIIPQVRFTWEQDDEEYGTKGRNGNEEDGKIWCR